MDHRQHHPRVTTPDVQVNEVAVQLGDRAVLDGVSLDVAPGETVALLGPNGAGKTTLVDCLQGFRRPDHGDIRVLDHDPWNAPRTWRDRLGVVLQDTRLDADLSVTEFINMTRGWYSDPQPTAESIMAVGLSGVARQRVHRLSGGERRRLDLALAMIGCPDLVFLDEPTAGLDPLAKREIWDLLTGLRTRGTTVLLCSHDLAEVERLADRVLILRDGSLLAEGTTEEIRRQESKGSAASFEDIYLSMLAHDGVPTAGV